MSDVILTNWTVYYKSDTGGDKQIRWTGAGSPQTSTNTVNALYSALADLFSISTQNEAHDTMPMQAVTPTVYNIGVIDQKDQDAWFIDPVSIQHLTGGSIQTVNWTRVVNADANVGTPGIVKMAYTAGGTAPSSTDVGRTITMTTDTDSGEILYVDVTNLQMWIRPTSCLAANSFDNTPTSNGAFTISGSSATGNQNGASVSSERLWSNIYSIGTIEDQTNLVVYQNFAPVTTFWASGHIDRLFLINDGFASGLIDSGFLTVFARQYSKLYDHFQADASDGGSNPVPISTNDDVNNVTGYRTMTVAGSSGTWTVGNYVYRSTGGLTWSTTDTKGVITAVSGSDITYYLIGDYTDFVAGADDVQEYNPNTGANGDASATSISSVANTTSGPTDTTPASITIVHSGTTQDLSNGNGSRPYSVIINCQGATLSQLYERLKYVTRNGQTTDIDTGANQSHIGQQYAGTGDLYLPYDGGSIDNPFSEVGGENITATSFTSVLTSKHDQGTSEGFIVVRNTRGTTPIDNATLTGGTSGNTALVDTDAGADPVTVISPIKTAPFGSFAGGQFFGARGVWIYNMHANDATNYQLTDSEGDVQVPPSSVSTVITVQALSDASAIVGANVLVWATDNANYFYQASVSITGSGTTATVTHSTHGLTSGDFVMIEGVTNDDDYNGAYEITVTDPNIYTYTTTETLGASPATGSPISTFVFISGLTDGVGVASDTRTLTANQPVSGWVRKSSASPYYQQGVISGTISTTTGFSTTIQLAADE